MPIGFWADLECAFLNGYQGRWQWTADSVGFDFTQGKSMLCIVICLIEMAVLSRSVQKSLKMPTPQKLFAHGLIVGLVNQPFAQPEGTT